MPGTAVKPMSRSTPSASAALATRAESSSGVSPPAAARRSSRNRHGRDRARPRHDARGGQRGRSRRRHPDPRSAPARPVPCAVSTILIRLRQMLGDLGLDAGPAGLVDEVTLVEQDQVGAEDLVLEHLFQRVVVLDRGVGRPSAPPAPRDRRRTGPRPRPGRRPRRRRRRPVTRARIAGQFEGLHQRLRQSEAGGLDQDVLGRVRPVRNKTTSAPTTTTSGPTPAAWHLFADPGA